MDFITESAVLSYLAEGDHTYVFDYILENGGVLTEGEALEAMQILREDAKMALARIDAGLEDAVRAANKKYAAAVADLDGTPKQISKAKYKAKVARKKSIDAAKNSAKFAKEAVRAQFGHGKAAVASANNAFASGGRRVVSYSKKAAGAVKSGAGSVKGGAVKAWQKTPVKYKTAAAGIGAGAGSAYGVYRYMNKKKSGK